MAAPLMRGSLSFLMNLYKFIQNAGKRNHFSDHADDNDQKHQKG